MSRHYLSRSAIYRSGIPVGLKAVFGLGTLGLLLLLCPSGVRADVIDTGNFTISDIVGGPYAGDTFTGTFTYDATALASNSYMTPLLSFTTDFPLWGEGSWVGVPYFEGGGNYPIPSRQRTLL